MSIAQRITMKFIVWEGVGPTKRLHRLRIHNSATIVFLMLNFPCDVRKAVSNITHVRGPSSSITSQNILQVQELIHSYWQITVREISAVTSVSYMDVFLQDRK